MCRCAYNEGEISDLRRTQNALIWKALSTLEKDQMLTRDKSKWSKHFPWFLPYYHRSSDYSVVIEFLEQDHRSWWSAREQVNKITWRPRRKFLTRNATQTLWPSIFFFTWPLLRNRRCYRGKITICMRNSHQL